MLEFKSTNDRWVKAITDSGTIRIVALDVRETLQFMAGRGALDPVETQGLGEAVISSLLLASSCSSGELVNLNIKGSGYLKQAFVDAHPEGKVRGYVIKRPDSDQAQGVTLDLLGPWGEGLLQVLRTRKGQKEPTIGTVPLATGYLAKDLTFYYYQSEQISSAVGLMVSYGDEVDFVASGFLIQAMPGATDEDLAQIEKHIKGLDLLDFRNIENKDARDPRILIFKLLESQSFKILEDRFLGFECPCSQERVSDAVALIGPTEIKSIIEEQGSATVTCEFCASTYTLDREKLESLLNSEKPKK
jgi:molecular chaperone Hsp33